MFLAKHGLTHVVDLQGVLVDLSPCVQVIYTARAPVSDWIPYEQKATGEHFSSKSSGWRDRISQSTQPRPVLIFQRGPLRYPRSSLHEFLRPFALVPVAPTAVLSTLLLADGFQDAKIHAQWVAQACEDCGVGDRWICLAP